MRGTNSPKNANASRPPVPPNPDTSNAQRVFDLLRSSTELLTVDELVAQSHCTEPSVRNALQALRDRRALVTVRSPDRAWRYGLRQSAERPADNRGKRQQVG